MCWALAMWARNEHEVSFNYADELTKAARRVPIKGTNRTYTYPSDEPTLSPYTAHEKGEIIGRDMSDFLTDKGDKLKIDDLLK